MSLRPQLNSSGLEPYCDWRVTVYDCIEGEDFVPMYWIMFSCGVIIGLETLYMISYKAFHGSLHILSGQIRGNEGSTIIVHFYAWALAILSSTIILVPNVSQIFREIAYNLPMIFLLASQLVYIGSIAKAVPQRYWDYVEQHVRKVFMPSRRLISILGLGFWLMVTTTTFVLACVLGAARDRGDVNSDVTLYFVLYEFWFIAIVILISATFYVQLQFNRVTRYLLEGSSVDAQTMARESRSLNRVNRLAVALFCGNFMYMLGHSFTPNIYVVYSLLPLSKFTCFCNIVIVPFIAFLNYTSETINFILYHRGFLKSYAESSDHATLVSGGKQTKADPSGLVKTTTIERLDNFLDHSPVVQ